MLGDCRVFKVGGAQAIAAMAYGTESVPRCDMIAGPGNVYVATAKRLVRDRVTVDLEAGPSEVVIYADACAVPAYAAADLLAQLEHDPLALAVVVSEDMAVLESVRDALGRQDAAPDGDVNMVLSSERALSIALVNAIAPEHLELMVEDAATMLPEVRSAGCVFLGPYSAVAMGDYIAGPSHVLPTGGTASRLSGLRAADFIRTMNVVSYTREGLEGDAAVARALASLEGLSSHARSVEIRNPGPATELEV
jgi:histidinol dehydrogenase